MKSITLPLLCLVGSALSAKATDLTPRIITSMVDGVVIERPYFLDGDKKYGIKLDSETKLTPSEGGALFRFYTFPAATMRLRPSPMPATTAFGPESAVAYEAAARILLPAAAEKVALVRSESDTLPINDWRSLRLTFSYRVANQLQRQSVTFLDLKPTEQIVIQTVASEGNFDEVTARAWNIIRRWHEIVPDKQQPYN